MKWWLRALLASIVLVALAAGGGGYLVALPGKADPEKGRVIGETIGVGCGVGVAFVWFAAFVFRKKSGNDS